MPQSLSSVHIHLVFSTKGASPFCGMRKSKRNACLFGGVSKKLDCSPLIVAERKTMCISYAVARTISQADWVKEIKRVSSIWIKQRNLH